MDDLIKRDDALTLVEQWFDTDDYLYSTIINDITNLPAIDLASLTPTPIADSHPAIDPAAIREAALQARIEELVKERDELGRKLNTARYGQPDFAWSIHEEEMADLRAKLAKAVEALRKMADGSSDNSEAAAKRVLAELEGK